MTTLRTEEKFCPACMKTHSIETVLVVEKTIYQGEELNFGAVYDYCEESDTLTENEDQISHNYKSMLSAYERKQRMSKRRENNEK